MAYIERIVGQTISSTIGSLANTTQTVALPREHFYSAIFLRLTYGASTTANFNANSEDDFITGIAVTINGQLTIKNYSWENLVNMNIYEHGARVDKSALAASTASGFTNAKICFSITPDDVSCLLPSHLLSTFDVAFTFGAATVPAGDTVVPVTLEMKSRELVNEGQKSSELFINKETTLTLTPTATGETAASTVRLPIGNLYRRFYLRTSGGASSGDQNTTVTNITLRQDGTILHRSTNFLQERSSDALEYHVAVAERVTGVAFVDLDMTEDVSQCVDSAPFSSWEMLFNIPSVANAVTVVIIPQELIPPQ